MTLTLGKTTLTLGKTTLTPGKQDYIASELHTIKHFFIIITFSELSTAFKKWVFKISAESG